jgi:hypothetical protein
MAPAAAWLSSGLAFGLLLLSGAAAALAADDLETRRARIEQDERMARGELARDLIMPDRFDDMRLLLPQLQSVVHGVVSEISYDYLDCEGPRTVVTLRRVEALLGGNVEDTIELRVLGGPLPNGSYVAATELPRFVEGASYVLLLRNTDWRFAPVMGDLAFREENLFDRPVLIDSDGFAVTGVSDIGIERNSEQITGAVGLNVVGVEAGREVTGISGEAGEIRRCRRGEPCAAETGPNERDRAAMSVTRDPTNRFARPEIIQGLGPEHLAAAIPRDELVGRLKRFGDELGIEIGGDLHLSPRLGCWNWTITDPWR